MSRHNRQIEEEQKQQADQIARTRTRKTAKWVFLIAAVCVILAAGVFGLTKYSAYSNKLVAEVRQNLVGKTFITHTVESKGLLGLGAQMYIYKQLTFNDESTADYARITTCGPKSDDDIPAYVGTYNYTITYSLTGTYKIHLNGTTFKLKVNDDNKPTGISEK